MKYRKMTASALALSILLTSANVANAESDDNEPKQEQSQKSNDENESKDESKDLKDKIYVEGADLNKNQADETADKLGSNDGYKKYEITTDDVSEYTGGTYDFIHSSATMVPKKFGKGVDVEIVTPDNITRITKEQYTNASITSGIENAKIKVASIDKVSGEGALTGIYKGLEEEGIEVDKQDVQNANQEMDDLASINEEQKNDGNDDYSDKALNNAVADMKEQVADKKADGDDISRDDVEKIVNVTLKAKGLDKVLSDNQKNKLVDIVYNTSQSKAMQKDPKSVAQQSKKLKDNLSDSVKKFNDDNDGILQKIWNGFKSFIQKIIEFISSIFDKLFG
jgi:uncharacterized protein YpuA (DUF1002 family)